MLLLFQNGFPSVIIIEINQLLYDKHIEPSKKFPSLILLSCQLIFRDDDECSDYLRAATYISFYNTYIYRARNFNLSVEGLNLYAMPAESSLTIIDFFFIYVYILPWFDVLNLIGIKLCILFSFFGPLKWNSFNGTFESMTDWTSQSLTCAIYLVW